MGYAWVTLMLATAISALFLTAEVGPRWGQFGLIHLLVPFTFGTLTLSFVYLAQRNLTGHRQTMQGLYVGACIVTGALTLLPGRFLGRLLWGAIGA